MPRKPASRHLPALLAGIGVAHRTVLLWRFRPDILRLAAGRHDLAVIQLYPLDVYRNHFPDGMWLLQQTPPVPSLVVKAALLVAAWPVAFTELLFALQAAMTIATALLLFGILRRVTGGVTASFGLAAWFMLSTDILVLENALYGQVFYENMAMLLVTFYCFLALRERHDRRAVRPGSTALYGTIAALAALTRSSLSYFAVVPALVGAMRWRRRHYLAYLLPVLLLQGGWAAKNAALYGHFTWQTSSWGGYSAANGLNADNQKQLLCDFIARQKAGVFPDWFVRSSAACPWPFENSAELGMPASVQAADAAANRLLGGRNPQANTRAASLKSAQYQRAVFLYAVAHPGPFLRRIADLYPLFWQRMGDYGALFEDAFVVAPVKRGLLDLGSRGFHEKQRIELSAAPPFGPGAAFRPAAFGTISLAPLDAVSIIVLHFLFPLLAVADLWRRRRGRPALLPAGSWMLAGVTLYGIVVFNVVDEGENMRFRLVIEPAIIALTAACVCALGSRRKKEGLLF